MGIWAKLFGGTETKQVEGIDPFISDLRGLADNASLGIAGKTAKRSLKAIGRGEYDSDPALAGFINPVRQFYNNAIEDNEREANMGANAMFGSFQPALSRRITELQNSRTRDAAGTQIAGMIPQIYSAASNTFQNAKNSKDNLKLSSLSAAVQSFLNSFRQEQVGGIIPALSGMASAASGLGFKPFAAGGAG